MTKVLLKYAFRLLVHMGCTGYVVSGGCTVIIRVNSVQLEMGFGLSFAIVLFIWAWIISLAIN